MKACEELARKLIKEGFLARGEAILTMLSSPGSATDRLRMKKRKLAKALEPDPWLPPVIVKMEKELTKRIDAHLAAVTEKAKERPTKAKERPTKAKERPTKKRR